jgi:hypothetical protein
VISGEGRVLATVFAAAQGSGPDGGLGVPNGIVRRALGKPLEHDTDTGPCAA